MLVEGNQHICVFVRQFDLAEESMYISVCLPVYNAWQAHCAQARLWYLTKPLLGIIVI